MSDTPDGDYSAWVPFSAVLQGSGREKLLPYFDAWVEECEAKRLEILSNPFEVYSFPFKGRDYPRLHSNVVLGEKRKLVIEDIVGYDIIVDVVVNSFLTDYKFDNLCTDISASILWMRGEHHVFVYAESPSILREEAIKRFFVELDVEAENVKDTW